LSVDRSSYSAFEGKGLVFWGASFVAVGIGNAVDEETPPEDWEEAIVTPTDYTGIRRQVFGSLKLGKTTKRDAIWAERRAVQKDIFQGSEVSPSSVPCQILLNSELTRSNTLSRTCAVCFGTSSGFRPAYRPPSQATQWKWTR
jgi:hypothetical protein